MSFTQKSFCLLALLLFCLIQIAACSTTVKPSQTTVALPSTTRISSRKYAWELDSAAMLAKSNFKIKPAALVDRCKAVVDKGIGLQNPDDLAEEFVFQFPIVGPLSKKVSDSLLTPLTDTRSYLTFYPLVGVLDS